MLVDESTGDMTGNILVGDPRICGRGRGFLATRHEIVKCMLTSVQKERRYGVQSLG